MRFAAVADTHAALWFLFADIRLSAAARDFIESAASDGRRIAVSPISLADTIYLSEKKRIPASAYEDLRSSLASPRHVFKEAGFTAEVAHAMILVPRDAIPDMPDRIVAATALHLSVPVLSRDGRIRASNLQTIW